MSMSYAEFAGALFGRVMASVAREEDPRARRLTCEQRRRVIQRFNLAYAAVHEVYRVADRLLAETPPGAIAPEED